MKKKKGMFNTAFVYVIDWDNGTPIYAVSGDINDIPEDCNGEDVGIYTLHHVEKFRIRRELGK